MVDNDIERKIVRASKSMHDHVCMNIFIQEERKKENSPSLLFNIFRMVSKEDEKGLTIEGDSLKKV